MTDLYARVAALSSIQRAHLARRLHTLAAAPETAVELGAGTVTPPAPQLVAYFVPAGEDAAAPATLRAHLRQRLPEYMVPAQFVPLRALPRTANGKLDQNALPDPALSAVQAPAADLAADVAGPADGETGPGTGADLALPSSAAEATLAQIWANVLGFDTISVHDNFFEVGGDSILSIQIVARASQAGLRLAPDDLFQHQTIAELARVLETRRPAARPAAIVDLGSSAVSLPLTPIQHWFFGLHLADPHHWNQALLLSSHIPLQVQHLEEALKLLVRRHDALRLTFRRVDPADPACVWRQEAVPPGHPAEPLVGSYTLPAHDPVDRSAMLGEIAAQVQGGFDLASGCLLRAAHVQGGASHEDLLLLAIHHLAVDAVSLGVLVEELAQIYRQLVATAPVRLPEVSATYREWAYALSAFAGEEPLRHELDFWSQMLATSTPPLPTDAPRPANLAEVNCEATTERVTVEATHGETMVLLHQKSSSGGAQINDLLLAALALTICEWCVHDTLLVGLEGHGREAATVRLDPSHSVGWFTSYYPVVLRLGADRTPAIALQAVCDQLHRIPQHGIGYGVLRYLTDAGERVLAPLPSSELLFNYLGQFDRSRRGWDFLTLAAGDAGPLRSPRNRRHHLLECNAIVLNGVLQLHWEYSNRLHRRATVERLANRYLEHLRSLIQPAISLAAASSAAASSAAPVLPVYTPADFPEANLTQAELDNLLAGLDL